jgi:hypothetical protein
MSGLNREHTWAYFNTMKPDGPRDDVMGQGGNNVKPVTQSTADWQAGYLAAMSDETPFYPLECRDRLAFWAGYNEGRAARKRAADAAGDNTSNV